MLAAADHCAGGLGVLGVVEIAEHDEIGVRLCCQNRVDLLAKDDGFLLAEIGFVGFGDGAARFEMRRDERERVFVVHTNIHLGESPAHAKPAAEQQE